MGWKASFIVIETTAYSANEQLLNLLGFDKLSKIEEKSFDTIRLPPANTVYIGSYNNRIIICDQKTSLQLIEENDSPIENRLKVLFPDSNICAVGLHSVVNFWGYSVIVNGQKIRAKAGSADEGTYIEQGLPLPEEEALLSAATIDGEGNRVYQLPEMPDELFTEDEVGENFVFAVCTTYLNEELNAADNKLMDTVFTGYKYSNILSNVPPLGTKPWWKFW
jgi:hypothetical protein